MPAAAAMSRVVVPWKPFSAKASTAAASSRARVAPAREGAPLIAPPSDPHAWLTRARSLAEGRGEQALSHREDAACPTPTCPPPWTPGERPDDRPRRPAAARRRLPRRARPGPHRPAGVPPRPVRRGPGLGLLPPGLRRAGPAAGA